MKSTIRVSILATALVAATAGLTGCGNTEGESAQATPSEWRFAIEEAQGSVQDRYAQRFKKLIEEASGGEITVTVYPYGALGTSNEITELLQNGSIQFAMASPGHLGTLIPEVQVFLLHFLFSDDEAINHEILSSPELIAQIDPMYREKRLKLLSVFTEGWQVWTTKGRVVRQPSDFEGLKFRVMTSPLLLAAYEAYGASPTPLSYGEIYSALQLNMIDGQVNPVFAIEEMSFYEVVDTMIFANHLPFIATAVTNQDFFDGLSSEHRKLVTDAIDQINDFVFNMQRQLNNKRLDTIKEKAPGVKMVMDLTDEERAAFRKASEPVREKYVEMAGERGQQLLDYIAQRVASATSEQ